MSLTFRTTVTPADPDCVRQLVAATGFFRADEIAVAVELVDERLAKGPASGYFFVFAELDGIPVGYTCYGPIACSVHSFDLYWIAVDPAHQGAGIGKALLRETERLIATAGGTRIYVETSGTDHYVPTRAFYARNGYPTIAELPHFYAPNDAKVISCKVLARPDGR